MEVAPYGTWTSPITGALAAAGGVRIGGLCLDGDDVLWVEGRPSERGRNVLCRRRADGTIDEVLPAAFNVRTRVHEYGGGAFTARRGTVFFVNDGDQRIWRYDPGSEPRPLTPEGPFRYADLTADDRHDRLLCVREEHRPEGEPVNTIAAVPLEGGASQVVVSGADFYAAPRPSPDGHTMAFLCWSHPHMPWQSSELHLKAMDGPSSTVVAGGPNESVLQPSWAPDGHLWFVSDRGGHWNLYRQGMGAPESLCPRPAEFGAAPWVFGLSTYGFVDERLVACAFQEAGLWQLGLLEPDTRRFSPIAASLTEVAYLHAGGGRAVFAGSSAAEPWAIYQLDASGQGRLLHRPTELAVDVAALSRPEGITFPTAGGSVAHGLHYPPHNPGFSAPPDERPPLVVITHGGPTAAASTALSLPIQFWTSRGFAVLDVNYRGSTGYGRAFRAALDGQWGIADVEDCVAGARDLAGRGLADPDRLLIRGGSAGGYTTLAALAFTDVFRAGASYYGVSDLESLATDTHKFESRYLDTLVGPYPARRDLYHARSPLLHADRLACPVIFFHGLEDKVVPPDQARRMVEVLRKKGVPVEYVTFPDEQHGFRRAENVAHALEAELAFYRRVLELSCGQPPGPARSGPSRGGMGTR